MRKAFGFVLFFLPAIVSAQPTARKSVEAFYVTTPISIDGVLDEEAYSLAQPATDFVQLQPYNGRPSYKPTKVYILFDQTALYVGAMFYDNPDSIYNFLSERDNIGPSDYFGVYFDPYNQGQLAYGFFITPAGVQTDIKAIKTNFDNEDDTWDAVWQSKTRLTDSGWIAELKIPYSAIRFPENGNGTWGLNMFRNIRRHNSNNSWNFIDRNVSGFIHQEGELKGMINIKPPVRLSFSPYAAAYMELRSGKSSPDFTYKAGMDLKYGISESFTLDMMLVPDFGQIQSDDQELNLSPYELFYSEKRQFFTEGTELFDRGGIFYSRRIGAKPKFADDAEDALGENEEIDYNPAETRLLNATKISGRTGKGWGLGFLNAMTLPSHATLKDTITGSKRDILIQPFTNYNVTVIDKSLKNNSYVSLINTNMWMANDPFRANVTATDFQLRDKAKKFAISGKGGFSTRNDGGHENGFFGKLALDKNGGKLRYGISQNVVSDKFNPNDMGYIKRPNELNLQTYINYNINEPFGIFKEVHAVVFYDYNRMYKPGTVSNNVVGFNTFSRFKNDYGIELEFSFSGIQHDYYEPRVEGRYFDIPRYYNAEIYFFTDFSKALAFEADMERTWVPETDQVDYEIETFLRYRIGRHLQLFYSTDFIDRFNDRGYVDVTDDESIIYFARRNVRSFENVIEAAYAFNNKSGLTFRTRHYWSGALNKEYFNLQSDGSLLIDPDYSENQDANYNAFNIDLIFRWIPAPGSELSIAWKNAIYHDEEHVTQNYWKNISETWNSDQINSFSIRFLYYIDYNNLKRKKI